jgi:hypothetical protein
LAVLDVHISPRVLQAAILENTVDKHPLIEDYMLIFESLVFVSSHTHLTLPLAKHPGKLALASPSTLPRPWFAFSAEGVQRGYHLPGLDAIFPSVVITMR